MDAAQVWRYSSVLLLQHTIIILDLSVNIAAPVLYPYNTVQLVLFVLQDIMLVMSIIVMFLIFFTTNVFRAGLISHLVKEFRAPIIVSFVYLTLSIFLHVLYLSAQWGHPFEYVWTVPMLVLYICQRVWSAFFYYHYKRVVLMLGDPKYYQDTEWLRSLVRSRA